MLITNEGALDTVGKFEGCSETEGEKDGEKDGVSVGINDGIIVGDGDGSTLG